MRNILFVDSALLHEKLLEALGQIYCRPDETVLNLIVNMKPKRLIP